VVFAIEMYFDRTSEMAVQTIWDALAAAGLPSLAGIPGCRPHVSLGVCGNLDVPSFSVALSGFAGSMAPFPITFSGIGVFSTEEGVLYLGVTVTRALLALHERFFLLSLRGTQGKSAGIMQSVAGSRTARWRTDSRKASGARLSKRSGGFLSRRGRPWHRLGLWTCRLCAARGSTCGIWVKENDDVMLPGSNLELWLKLCDISRNGVTRNP